MKGKVQLVPLGPEHAKALWDAVDSSRPELKRRFNWASAALSAEDEARFIRAAAQGDFTAAIVEGRTRRVAGIAALESVEPAPEAKAKLALWIRTDRAGRGFATEAGELLVEHGFKTMGLHRLYARIDPANRAGRKTVQKIGFRYEGCLRGDKRLNNRWVHQECWGLLKSEWKK